jgi:hypothetical protein
MDIYEQSTDNCVVLPNSFYIPEDISNGELPSVCYTTENLGDTSLFAKLGSLQTMDPWDLEELGYTYDALIVRHDGRIEGAEQSPDYYAYSSARSDTWDAGLQAIEDHEWSANKVGYEADEVANACTAESITGPQPETAAPSLTKLDNHDDFSRSSESPEPLVLEEVADQSRRDEVSSPLLISRPSKRHGDDALFVREDVFEETTMVPATDADSARDDVSMPDEVVEIESAEAAMTLTSDPRHANALPAQEELLHDDSVVDESNDQFGPDDIVTGLSALMSNPTGKPHDTAALDDTSQNGVERAHSPHSSRDLPVQPSKPVAPSLADSPSPARISDQGLQPSSEAKIAYARLENGATDEVPGHPFASSPSGQMIIKEPGENVTTSEPREYAEDLATEALEDLLSSEAMRDSSPTQIDEQEHEETEQPEDSVTVGELEIISIPTNTEALATDNQLSAPVDSSEVPDQLKRRRSLDDEQETPAKKKTKANESAQPTASESELSSEDVDETVTLPMAASRRLAPTKSPKETKAGNDKGPKRKRKSKNVSSIPSIIIPSDICQTRKPPTKKTVEKEAVSKEADIYFEEDTRPTEDGSASALLRTNSDDDKPSMISDDYEHLSDISDLPPRSLAFTSLRAPRNIVSNRELASLGSTLAPGMHPSLHNHLNAMPMRIRKSSEGTETPVKSSSTGNLFMVDEDDTTELVAKRKRIANKKTSAPKKAAPRRARGINTKQHAPEEEDEQELFPRSMTTPSKETNAPTPLPKKIASQKANDKKTEDQTRQPAKRQTRSDANLDTTSATQPKSSPVLKKDTEAEADEDEDAKPNTAKPKSTPKSNRPHEDDDAYTQVSDVPLSASPDPLPARITTRKKPVARPAPLKKTSTLSSITTSSTPARNIYGFSPRKTRSGGTLAASKAKTGKATSVKGKVKGKGKGSEEAETEVKTAALEEKEEEKKKEKAAKTVGGIEKRLRSKG